VWSRRWIFLLAAGFALSAVYRRAVRDDAAGELLVGWDGFLLFWIPAAVLIGLGITYAWPWVSRRWQALRHRHR
jgi:sensor c-di-GMP phosphodiesterase-like protein